MHGGEWRAHFMGYIGNKLAPQTISLFQVLHLFMNAISHSGEHWTQVGDFIPDRELYSQVFLWFGIEAPADGSYPSAAITYVRDSLMQQKLITHWQLQIIRSQRAQRDFVLKYTAKWIVKALHIFPIENHIEIASKCVAIHDWPNFSRNLTCLSSLKISHILPINSRV
jgi:hypothetical protein